MKILFFVAMALLAVSACVSSGPSTNKTPSSITAPAEQRQRVMLTGFECGDNCYVHYRPLGQPEGEVKTALCTVGGCISWMTEQSFASKFERRPATITLGTGKQYDSGGAVMSIDFPAITSLKVDPAQ
ncbi:MAG: hypothetical protein ABJP02_11160 [Parasphingorhabdus sp.]|uniref:hypothetical protein n=1 Tax=Parasphingorhabdus sp. TaxID=2709688 RepID=UPI00329A5203